MLSVMADTTIQALPRRGASPEATRARIEEAAERLFRTLGYQKTAVADIARELGMSPANVYRFYPSKSAINEAIAARMLAGVEAESWSIARGPGPAPLRLRTLLTRLHERHVTLFFQERRLHDMVSAAMAEHWDVIKRFINGIGEAIRHVLVEGMEAGDFARRDPEATELAVRQACMAFLHPFLIAECLLRDRDEAAMAAQFQEVIGLILRGLRL
jgi:AcrR family transcriptional regulator